MSPIVAVVAALALQAPPATDSIDAAAHVVAVPDAEHVVIGRGRRDGFVAGAVGLPVSPRGVPTAERKTPAIEWGVVIAVADVERVDEDSALLRLRDVRRAPKVGDHVAWSLPLDARRQGLRDSPLFWLAALDIGARTLEGERELVALSEVLAADQKKEERHGNDALPAAWRAHREVLGAMVDEIHAQAELATSVYAEPLDRGDFRGKHLAEAFAETRAADVARFWDYVLSRPGGYMTWSFNLVDIYGTWLLRGTPRGADFGAQRRLAVLEIELGQALRLMRWERAERLLNALLRLQPADVERQSELAAVASIRRADAALERDPSDDKATWMRARSLSAVGLHAAAIAGFEALVARGYRGDDARRQLGYALCGASRWDACERHFDALILARGKRLEPDPELEKWRAFARSRGTNGGNLAATDRAAHVATAQALEGEGAWEMAIASWRNAVVIARDEGDRDALAAAERGLVRASERVELVEEVQRGVSALERHDLARAEKALAAVRRMARRTGEPAAAVSELAALAKAARDVDEPELARSVLEARVADLAAKRADASAIRGGALADLAEQLAADGEPDAAERLFEEAVALAPGDIAARAKRAWFYAERGRWADAFSVSFIAAGKSEIMSWVMVRASAARNRFDDALGYAARLGRAAPRLGSVDAAVHRLMAATEALANAGALSPDAVARLVLRRIRALCEIGLEPLAAAELPALAAFPELRREAAWAIARPPSPPRPGIDLFPPGERLRAAEIAAAGAEAAERARRRDELAAEVALDNAATPAERDRARVALARLALATGRFHRAWALVRRGAPRDVTALVGLAERGLAGEHRLAQAEDARERGDADLQYSAASEARAHFAATGTPARRLAATLLLAQAELAMNRREAAAEHAAAALVEARFEGDPRLVRAFEALLIAARTTGQAPDLLERTLTAHLAQCVAQDDDACRAETQLELARVMIQRGRVSDAFVALGASVEAFEGLHQRARARAATMLMVRVYRLRSELPKAVAKAQEVLAAAIGDGDGPAERTALLELGSLALVGGDLESARRWLASALDAAERGRDRHAAAIAEATRGRAELQLDGDRAVAIAALERALAGFDAEGELGDALATRIALGRALATSDETLGRARALLADATRAAGALGRDVLQLEALLALAAAHLDAADTRAAAPLVARAESLAATVELDDLAARTTFLRARLQLASADRPAAADSALIAAHRLSGPLARGTLPLGRAETQAIFQQAADLLFELGRHGDALDVLELQRTATEPRVFDIDQLRHAADFTLAADLARYAEARARDAAIDARLREDADLAPGSRDAQAHRQLVALAAASQAELEPLAARLEREHPAHYKALARDPASLAKDRRKLPNDTALVEYFVGDSALFLFVVRPGHGRSPAAGPITALRVAVDRRALADTVARYKKLVATDSRLAEPLARELHGWLVASLADLVPPAERARTTLILLPHGPLFDVPFPALVSSPPDAPAPRYAIEDWRFVIASATTLAPLLSGPRKLDVLGPVLGLTDPDGSLPEARKELDRLPDALAATVLRGHDATEERLVALSPAHRILHLATHGTAAADPRDSSLLLASGGLTVERIANLHGLRDKVALVFLSACASASEVAGGPNEPISLAEGFALAGVPTVIGSLWDVDDRATRVLVESFYRHLADGRLDTLGALRAAQLATLRTTEGGRAPFADPRYWGAFQLIGDFR